MVGIFEDLLAMSFSDLGLLLLRLAEGDEQGKFEETYEALRPHGLEALERLFARFELKPTPERRITFIQALARQWKKYLQETQPKLAPQVFKEIFITWTATILLDYLYNTLFAYVSFKERPQYVRAWVEGVGEGAVIKFKKRPTIEEATFTGINILAISKWIRERIRAASTQNLLPPYPGLEKGETLEAVWGLYISTLLFGAAKAPPDPNPLVFAALAACYRELLGKTVPEIDFPKAAANILRHLLRLGLHLGAAERLGWVSEGARVAGLTEVRVVYRRDKGLLPDPHEKANQVDPKQPIHHRPVVDVAIVNYANEPKHELLDWASKTLNEVRKDPEWPNCKGAWGLNVVAVVITERLDAEKVKEFLVKLKDHPLLTQIARDIRKRAAELPPNSAYISTAFVVAWRSEGSNHVNYVWIDYGPHETPVELRRKTLEAIAAVQPSEELVEIEINEKAWNPTFSNSPVILAGG
jgi:hypothetical protein